MLNLQSTRLTRPSLRGIKPDCDGTEKQTHVTENAAYSHVPGGFLRPMTPCIGLVIMRRKGLGPYLVRPPAPSNLDLVNSVEKVIVYCYIVD